MRRPGVAVLSTTYDPGWTATVNGRPQPTQIVAPALVAVDVPAGTDHVAFRYHGYGHYPPLLALSGLTLGAHTGDMRRIIGTIVGAILAISLAITTVGRIVATLKTFLIIGLIAMAVIIIVWLVARRPRPG
jgi:hypothetical protein